MSKRLRRIAPPEHDLPFSAWSLAGLADFLARMDVVRRWWRPVPSSDACRGQ
jgi:hypothetical protein